jgi:hypothetical protein
MMKIDWKIDDIGIPCSALGFLGRAEVFVPGWKPFPNRLLAPSLPKRRSSTGGAERSLGMVESLPIPRPSSVPRIADQRRDGAGPGSSKQEEAPFINHFASGALFGVNQKRSLCVYQTLKSSGTGSA